MAFKEKVCLRFVTTAENGFPEHNINSILGLKRVLYKYIRKAHSMYDIQQFNMNVTNPKLTDKELSKFINSFCEDKFDEVKKK